MDEIIRELEHLISWSVPMRSVRTRFEAVLEKLKGAALEQQTVKKKPKRDNPRAGS